MSEEKNLQVQEKEEVQSETERTRDMPAFVPNADIYETEDQIVLLVDMPGVDENSIDINLERNVLTISGCVEPVVPEGYSLSYAEYRIGDYQRSFVLSNQINQEQIDATIRDGVLRLYLPKIGPEVKKIGVKPG